MRESELERYFCRKLQEAGCLTYKFVSPGNAGVPDRLIVAPGGRVAFAELKAPGGKPRPLQRMQIKKLRGMGCAVFVVDSKEWADRVAQQMGGGPGAV